MLAVICSILATVAPVDGPHGAVSAPAAKQRVLGGAAAVDVSDAGVQAAAAFAAGSVDAELGEVTSATRQVVAGTIYRITFTTTDGRAYSAEVFRNTDGEHSVRSIDETGDHHGDIAAEPESEG